MGFGKLGLRDGLIRRADGLSRRGSQRNYGDTLVTPSVLYVHFAADNAFEVFACEKERIMSGEMTVEELLGPELMKDVSDFYVSPHVFIVRNSPSLHLSLHKVNDYVIIEAEPKVCHSINVICLV